MLFDALATASVQLAATSRRGEKVKIAAAVLRALHPDEVAPSVALLMGEPLQRRIGVGWATLAATTTPPATQPTVEIGEVDAVFASLLGVRGIGSVGERQRVLGELLGRCTAAEQDLVRRALMGDVRHGALEGVLTDAVAAAFAIPLAAIRRAAMLGGSLPEAARAASSGGIAAVEAVSLSPLRPVQPMLASPAASVADALALTGRASVEWKLDGARLQAHKRLDEVRLFTRNLNEVTDRLDGIVAAVRALPAREVVLDGEALGVSDDGAPRRFQDTMGDFGADEAGRGSGLAAFFFDVLLVDGDALIDAPWTERRAALDALVPAPMRMPSVVTDDVGTAERAAAAALDAGHEGVVLKAVGSAYEAGRRGGAWRKVKPVHTLDLVVLAAEWGYGRRTGWLSNLHLGALAADGGFVMVGKTFKGLTDAMLTWQTETLSAIATGPVATADRRGAAPAGVVFVRPELVVEIALDGVQVSRRYPGGVALRFARVRRYRLDKSPSDADTIDQVRALLR